MRLTGMAVLCLTLLVAIMSLAGCASTTRLFTKPIAEAPYVTYPEWGPNRNVAVMPFLNISKDKDAGVKVRDLLVAELYISGAFKEVVDEGEVSEVMKKLKVREGEALGKDTLKTLGDNLGVQAIIFGTVQEYSERSAKGALFAVSLRMVDVETGQILWLGNASKEGGGSVSEALGLSDGPTIIEVARSVVEDLVDDLVGEIKSKRGKSKKVETSKKAAPDAAGMTGSKEPAPAQGKEQAGAAPSPAVKGTAAGATPAPALGGN